ncbi:MAG TPA: hypothetical protein PLI09_12150 [Candidatus Hydrogenedentes bacterium]|nr:hypothetical protein [Candidatus Hydrogenedentota bacterium]
MSRIEDKHPDVLQNIEFAIVDTYRQYRELSDYDVMRVLEASLETYAAEKAGRSARTTRLSELEQLLLEWVLHMCEWRLGRIPLGNTEEVFSSDDVPITIDEIILCLKRLLKSVNRWNKDGGRQGYLNFIVQYVK